MHIENLENIEKRINQSDHYYIYCAGKFAYVLIEWIFKKNLESNLMGVITSDGEDFNSSDVLGIPVFNFSKVNCDKNDLIIVTILSKETGKVIENNIISAGYKNVVLLSYESYKQINKEIIDYVPDIRCEIRHIRQASDNILKEINQLKNENRILAGLIQSMPMVAETHIQSFATYKDINLGKVVVVAGTGPSLNLYKYNPGFVHVGVNSLCFSQNIKLDYYFAQHLPQSEDILDIKDDINPTMRRKMIDGIKNLSCVKFIGQHLTFDGYDYGFFLAPPMGSFSDDSYNKYYFFNNENSSFYCKDIRYGLLWGDNSTIFPAMQFALFTNPQKIYILGCDGYMSSSGDNYWSEEEDREQSLRFNNFKYDVINKDMLKRWISLKKFIQINYQDIDVRMVNPGVFKGVFKEAYTDENGNIVDI